MKKLLKSVFILAIAILPRTSHAQTANVTFKASLRTVEDQTIPRVYLKIYKPGEAQAIDSVFSDDQGQLILGLPFTYNPVSIENSHRSTVIVKKIHPNIITHDTRESYLEYNYPGYGELYFMDLRGRIFPNHSNLSGGIYYYFIRFDDGRQSELNKVVVTEDCKLGVRLINIQRENGGGRPILKAADSPDVFYVDCIKDGYITHRDTLAIDSVVIVREYQLLEAAAPTASFTFSGVLEVGNPVVFDASASSAANGEELVYSWDFGDGKRGQSSGIPHLYNVAGDYEVCNALNETAVCNPLK